MRLSWSTDVAGVAACAGKKNMYKSGNVAARIFERQILTPKPGTSV